MRIDVRGFVVAALVGFAALSVSAPAEAKCTKLGFSVNDFGKEGPANDAKRLLDDHIAEWTSQNGIKKYRTGTKSVSCELYLDFGFANEHTCMATASVCW